MTRRFRLAGVLRARQAQEDAAKGGVLRARADAAAATQRRDDRDRALAGRSVPAGGAGTAYVAALAAQQALAGELSAAGAIADGACEVVSERQADVTDAAMRRRAVERLTERHQAARRLAEDRAGQRALDELASTRRQAGRGTDW